MKLSKKEEFKSDMMLLLVTMWWGLSYYFIHIAMDEVGVFSLNAYRFIGAFAITAVVFRKRLKETDRETVKASFVVGALLAITYGFTNLSIYNTSTTNAAFLCAMAVIMVPVIEFLVFHKKAKLKVLVSVVLSTLGIALLTLKDGFSLDPSHVFGDVCGILCALFYAFEMIYTGKYVKEKSIDPVKMGVLSLGWTGLIMLIVSLFFEGISIPSQTGTWLAIAFLTIFCTALSFILQPVAQKNTEASHVGLIFALEPVFASIVAVITEHDIPGPKQMAGEALMLAAMVLIEINFKSSKVNDKGHL